MPSVKKKLKTTDLHDTSITSDGRVVGNEFENIWKKEAVA
jgi:hypothetical protein